MGFPLSFKQKKEAIKPTGFILMNLVTFTIGHMLKPVFKIFISHFSERNPDPAMEELPFTICPLPSSLWRGNLEVFIYLEQYV